MSGIVKTNEDADAENVDSDDESLKAGVQAVCLAGHEMEESSQKISAVLAPVTEKEEVKSVWGFEGKPCNRPLEYRKDYFFCVTSPTDSEKHVVLPDDHIG